MKKVVILVGSTIAAAVLFLGLFAGRGMTSGVTLTPLGYLPSVFRPLPTPTPTNTPVPTNTPTVIPTSTATGIPPSATPTRTPSPTATTGPQPSGNVQIISIFYDGSGPSEPDEYVEIRNEESFPVQLLNWTLRDNAAVQVFTFPSFVIQPNQTCRVYTNVNSPQWCGFSYESGSAIWNNTGDCAFLRNSGGTLIDQFCY